MAKSARQLGKKEKGQRQGRLTEDDADAACVPALALSGVAGTARRLADGIPCGAESSPGAGLSFPRTQAAGSNGRGVSGARARASSRGRKSIFIMQLRRGVEWNLENGGPVSGSPGGLVQMGMKSCDSAAVTAVTAVKQGGVCHGIVRLAWLSCVPVSALNYAHTGLYCSAHIDTFMGGVRAGWQKKRASRWQPGRLRLVGCTKRAGFTDKKPTIAPIDYSSHAFPCRLAGSVSTSHAFPMPSPCLPMPSHAFLCRLADQSLTCFDGAAYRLHLPSNRATLARRVRSSVVSLLFVYSFTRLLACESAPSVMVDPSVMADPSVMVDPSSAPSPQSPPSSLL
ncbi:hypothetical protein AOQ84DRAFT_222774 [Glonium stellatum]|uniref:Uncharacterized protein n=1 Tax=Glonium stellatum TaxID=574774 RepID=A0A8E2EZ29_9PEZI|nr:hypothetical protein AOQ84DRAFT_222774 [Glonium stellatum]